jgi:hypothetical protein
LSKLVHVLNCGKNSPKMLATFCNFQNTIQIKQSLNGRKFAQSGHPGCCLFASTAFVSELFDSQHVVQHVCTLSTGFSINSTCNNNVCISRIIWELKTGALQTNQPFLPFSQFYKFILKLKWPCLSSVVSLLHGIVMQESGLQCHRDSIIASWNVWRIIDIFRFYCFKQFYWKVMLHSYVQNWCA